MSKLMEAFKTISRSYHKPVHMKSWEKEMVKSGFVKYYPRDPKNFKDPEFKPSKLLLIRRIKPYKGQPHWHKHCLEQFKIHERGFVQNIVKNTPSVCAKLWSIKHLIKISPICLPENISEEDVVLGGTFLSDYGEFKVFKKVDPICIEESKNVEKHEKKMDKVTIKRQLRHKWLNPIE